MSDSSYVGSPDDECSAGVQFSIILLTIIAACCFVVACYSLYIFSKSKHERRTKLDKAAELTFLVSTIISMILMVTLTFDACGAFSDSVFRNVNLYAGVFFLLQCYITLVLFYRKLLRIFNTTAYALTKCTSKIYNTVFILLAVIQCIWFLLQLINFIVTDMPSTVPLVMLSMLLTFILNISMVVLFTSKLIKTMKGIKDIGGQDLLPAISKLTILTVTSVVTTFVDYIWHMWQALQPSLQTDAAFIVTQYIWVLDVFTNFLCIALCYQEFRKYYLKFCGCVDGCCRRTVNRMYVGSKSGSTVAAEPSSQPTVTQSAADTRTGNTASMVTTETSSHGQHADSQPTADATN
eukprot:760835_1